MAEEVIDVKARTDIAVVEAITNRHIDDCSRRYRENVEELRSFRSEIRDGFKDLHKRVSGTQRTSTNWKLNVSYGVIIVLLAMVGTFGMIAIQWN